MVLFTGPSGRRRLIALIGGAVCLLIAKLYLFVRDREAYEDGNLLITAVFTAFSAGAIYVVLTIVARAGSRRRPDH